MASIPDNSWWHMGGELEQFAQSFDPAARLATKDSRIWGVSDSMQTFATTIGRTVYIPVDWTADQVQRVIPHEVLGHIKQFRWAGFFIHPTIGIPLGLFLYAIIPFPILIAWVRYRMELHAETKSWEYHLKLPINGWTPDYVRAKAQRFGKNVGGKAYFYSVPKRWAVWGFNRRAEKVIKKVGR